MSLHSQQAEESKAKIAANRPHCSPLVGVGLMQVIIVAKAWGRAAVVSNFTVAGVGVAVGDLHQ